MKAYLFLVIFAVAAVACKKSSEIPVESKLLTAESLPLDGYWEQESVVSDDGKDIQVPFKKLVSNESEFFSRLSEQSYVQLKFEDQEMTTLIVVSDRRSKNFGIRSEFVKTSFVIRNNDLEVDNKDGDKKLIFTIKWFSKNRMQVRFPPIDSEQRTINFRRTTRDESSEHINSLFSFGQKIMKEKNLEIKRSGRKDSPAEFSEPKRLFVSAYNREILRKLEANELRRYVEKTAPIVDGSDVQETAKVPLSAKEKFLLEANTLGVRIYDVIAEKYGMAEKAWPRASGQNLIVCQNGSFESCSENLRILEQTFEELLANDEVFAFAFIAKIALGSSRPSAVAKLSRRGEFRIKDLAYDTPIENNFAKDYGVLSEYFSRDDFSLDLFLPLSVGVDVIKNEITNVNARYGEFSEAYAEYKKQFKDIFGERADLKIEDFDYNYYEKAPSLETYFTDVNARQDLYFQVIDYWIDLWGRARGHGVTINFVSALQEKDISLDFSLHKGHPPVLQVNLNKDKFSKKNYELNSSGLGLMEKVISRSQEMDWGSISSAGDKIYKNFETYGIDNDLYCHLEESTDIPYGLCNESIEKLLQRTSVTTAESYHFFNRWAELSDFRGGTNIHKVVVGDGSVTRGSDLSDFITFETLFFGQDEVLDSDEAFSSTVTKYFDQIVF